MKRNITIRQILTALLAGVLFAMLLSAPAFADTKSKRTKTIKVYDADGKMTSQTSYTYDSKGNTKKAVYKSLHYDYNTQKSSWVTSTTTYTRKYHANGNIKKVTSKSKDSSYVTTYDAAGRMLKSVDTYKSNGQNVKVVTTYKYGSNGNRKSSVTKRNGVLSSKSTYDSKGYLKTRKEYDEKGKKVVNTTKYTYKFSKGRMVKETEKRSDGGSTVWKYKYNKKGNQTQYQYTSKYKQSDGSFYTSTYGEKYSYSFNKDGTIKRRTCFDLKTGNKTGYTDYKYTKKKY